MENLIKHGPLDPIIPDNAPNPSNLDSITDKEHAASVEGHDVVLRTSLSSLRSANE